VSSPQRDIDRGLPLSRRVRAIVSVSAGSVLYTLDANLANVALPTIARALGVPAVSSVILVSVYNLVLAMVLLPLAAVGERLGHRRVFAAGLILYLFAAGFCFVADSLPLLIVARGFQALAAGAVLSVSLAMVRSIYPASQLGRGLGLNTVAAASGAALAPATGGFILVAASWHWVFTAGVPLALVALCFAVSLPETDLHQGRFDLRGAILCAISFGLLIFGLQMFSEGRHVALALPVVAAGLLTSYIFVRCEIAVAVPVLPVDLFARPTLALSVAAAFAAVLSSTALLLYVPFRLTALGLSPPQIGTMLVPYAVTVTIFAPASGMLSDRVSPSVLGTAGLAIALVAAISLGLVPARPGFFDIAWRVALCGAGFGMFFSPNGRLIVGSVPRTRAAVASSLIATTRMFGQALGPILLGALLVIPGAPSAPAIAAACLAALGCLLSAARIALPQADA
jgi:MFS transporter, DHA2 family, multidrug resistance protein